eukprot:251627-Rhodomonas_salina.1
MRAVVAAWAAGHAVVCVVGLQRALACFLALRAHAWPDHLEAVGSADPRHQLSGLHRHVACQIAVRCFGLLSQTCARRRERRTQDTPHGASHTRTRILHK